MEKLKLLSISADGPDAYIVRCVLDGSAVDYKFTYFINASGSRVLEHEDSFYSVTCDDPAAEWLERAILAFDRARLKARDEFQREPRGLVVDEESTDDRHQYKIVSQSEFNEEIDSVAVIEQNDTRTASWKFGTFMAKLEPPGLWVANDKSDSLLEAVLMLHQSIYPKYKVEQSS